MKDQRLIRSIKLKNFLSFGEGDSGIELKPLNVLIGPNASGKSNFIESLRILRAAPKDLLGPIREGGGVGEWLWKGPNSPYTAEIEAIVKTPDGTIPLRHSISFTMSGQRFELVNEKIENERPERHFHDRPRIFYDYGHGSPVLSVFQTGNAGDQKEEPVFRTLRREDVKINQSILSQRKDPEQYPEITSLGEVYENIMLYGEWNLGRYTPPRLPQKADLQEDFLLEDASNLGLVLNDLDLKPGMRDVLLDKLKEFHEDFSDIGVKIHGGTVQIFLHEGLNEAIPATRLSDGTLRYLCLLAILCHPSPPPLICIEEPELGVHPDIIPTIAELLIEASTRTQLVITTHSDHLVDALTESPDSVIICEKENGATTMQRFDKASLAEWLKKYTLGQLWRRGDLGGNRW